MANLTNPNAIRNMLPQRLRLIPLLAVVILFSCKTTYQPQSVKYHDYRITHQQKADSALVLLMRPYADSVSRSMSNVVAVASTMLEKKQPEGTLGNVLADAMLFMAREKFSAKVDAAFINYGGIRLPSVAPGNITKGKVFEMAPFDNLVVLQQVSGKTFQAFLDFVAGRGGWPCAGVRFRIKNKKAVDVMVGDAPLDETATYTIANNDYVANGGDDCEVLKKIPQQNKGYVFRDAVLDYFAAQTKAGKTIQAKIENRITNAE